MENSFKRKNKLKIFEVQTQMIFQKKKNCESEK